MRNAKLHKRIKVPEIDRRHSRSISVLLDQAAATSRSNLPRSDVRSSLLAAIKSCTSSRDLDRGRICHEDAISLRQDSNLFVASSLVNMYAKCGSMDEARKVFGSIPYHNVVTWNTLILGYVEIGQEEIALDAFRTMQIQGCDPDARSIVSAIKACTGLATKEPAKQVGGKLVKIEALNKGLAIHAQVLTRPNLQDVFVASTLVTMYAKCGSIENADAVFQRMPCHNVVAWNTIILGSVENLEPDRALQLFATMLDRGSIPNPVTFVAALKACSNLPVDYDDNQVNGRMSTFKVRVLETCMNLHSESARFSCDSNVFVASLLVQIYAKLGTMVDAARVFENMPQFDAATLNSMLLGYIDDREEQIALEMFRYVEAASDFGSNAQSFVAATKACAIRAASEKSTKVDGKMIKVESLRNCVEIHSRAARRGFESELFVASSLVDLYAKSGDLSSARKLFDKIDHKDVVAWTSIILGHAENGDGDQALGFFRRMESEGCIPDALTIVAAIKACIALAAKEESREVDGKMIKSESLRQGSKIYSQSSFRDEIIVANTAMDLYSKCGSMIDARRVFDRIDSRSVVSWTVMILGYAENGDGEIALEFFDRMNCAPNSRTFVAAMKACCCLAEKEHGRMIDSKIVKVESLRIGKILYSEAVDRCCDAATNIFLGNTVLDLFVKCGSMVDAREFFDKMPNRDEVSWTILLLGYAESNEFDLVLGLFDRMRDESIDPDPLAFVAAIKACAGLATKEDPKQLDGNLAKLDSLIRGIEIHSRAAIGRLDDEIFVANTLIDMYAKCWSMPDARRIFDRMESHTIVSWNALIQGYADGDQGDLALELFFRMESDGFDQDHRTLAAAIKACGTTVSIETGRVLHSRSTRLGLEDDDPVLGTCLIDLYGKCGCMIDSLLVFDRQKNRDSVAFAALISGYSRQGDMIRALDEFREMRREGRKPEAVTFVSLLSGFSHSGLVDRAKRCFGSMQPGYGVAPGIEHYVCMVDLLGRNNELGSAVAMVESSQILARSRSNSAVAWTAILSACQKWSNVEVARVAFANLQRLDAAYGPAYVLFANVCGSVRTQSCTRIV